MRAGRVAVRFSAATLAKARKAVEEAPHHDYVETVAASDNLRWTLSPKTAGSGEAPLGRKPAETPAAATETASN